MDGDPSPHDRLPRVYRGDRAMAQIVAVIGDQAAQQLARAFGGTELYVPAKPGDHLTFAKHPATTADLT